MLWYGSGSKQTKDKINVALVIHIIIHNHIKKALAQNANSKAANPLN